MNGTDINDQPREFKIVALARNRNTLRSTATYLGRRSVSVEIVSSLAELVERLAMKKANLALISVDYPHGKIEMIPALLKQSFEAETIVFAERPDRKTEAKLASPLFKHPIFGAISGLSVMMRLKKIEQELNGETGEFGDRGKGDELDIHIKNQHGEETAIFLKGERQRDPKDAMAQLMKALSEGDHKPAIVESKSHGHHGFEQEGAKGRGTAHAHDSAREDALDGIHQPLSRKLSRAEIEDAIEKGRLSHAPSGFGGSRRRGRRGRKASWYENMELDASDSRGARKKKSGVIEHDIERGHREVGAAIEYGAETTGEAIAEAVLHDPAEKLIMKCAREALRKICGKIELPDASKMELRFAALIGVSAPTLRGSVVCAIPFTTVFHGTAILEFEGAFIDSLEASGVSVQADRCSIVHLDDLSIAQEVMAGSKLVLFSKAKDKHVAIALVSGTHCPPVLRAEDNMFKVQVVDIETEVRVTFDVFIHMPANQKYLRYLKCGSILSRRQSLNLIQRNVEHVYLSAKDVEEFIRFFVTRSLARARANDEAGLTNSGS